MTKGDLPKNFKIQQFKEEDLDVVMDINLKTLPENYPDYFFKQIYYKFPKSFLVARDKRDKKIIGYCMFREEKGISNFGLKWVKKGHLVSIAVLEEYRRFKLGSFLLKKGLESMKNDYGAKEAILEVRLSNFAAIEMYKKFNFKVAKTYSGYYKDGEDAYLMAIPLK